MKNLVDKWTERIEDLEHDLKGQAWSVKRSFDSEIMGIRQCIVDIKRSSLQKYMKGLIEIIESEYPEMDDRYQYAIKAKETINWEEGK